MADINIHDITIGIYTKGLTVLLHILQKSTAHPDASTFPAARLIDDMLPLSFHVQSVSHTVCKSLKKLGLDNIPDMQDSESTMEEVIARVVRTLELVRGVGAETMDGREGVRVRMPGGDVSGKQFVLGFAVPNFFFHLQTVYAILRMRGVGLGKEDYLTGWAGEWDREV